MPVVDLLTAVVLLIGAGFSLIAAIGIARLPDIYTRMHSASKAGTLGSGLLLLGLALYAGEVGVWTRAVAAFVFLLLTAPVAAHLLARAAYAAGYKPAPETQVDALAEAMGTHERTTDSHPSGGLPS